MLVAYHKDPMKKKIYLLILTLFIIFIIDSVWGKNPYLQDLSNILEPPSSRHLLGTDYLGRDFLARLTESVKISIGLAMFSTFVSLLLGTALTVLASTQNRIVENTISLVADGIAAVPALIWVLLCAAIAPGAKWALYSGLIFTAWIEFFRYLKPTVRHLMLGEPVQAARLLGFKELYIFQHYLWPEIKSGLTKIYCYGVASAVLAVAALGFIGVGIRPPTAELGLMMSELLPYYLEAPWLLIFTVFLLIATILTLKSLAKT